VNTLCGKKVLQHKESDDPETAHIEENVKIQPITVGTWLQLRIPTNHRERVD
jgi:hypothetical protein